MIADIERARAEVARDWGEAAWTDRGAFYAAVGARACIALIEQAVERRLVRDLAVPPRALIPRRVTAPLFDPPAVFREDRGVEIIRRNVRDALPIRPVFRVIDGGAA